MTTVVEQKARAAAEQRYNDAMPARTATFVTGYITRAAEEPSDEQVKAAALVILAHEEGLDPSDSDGILGGTWFVMDDDESTTRLSVAREALRAARDIEEAP